ncbi:MAG: NINE protein [Ramlibacter sp.]|nr:NINE protein [Ramlibacter sp.]
MNEADRVFWHQTSVRLRTVNRVLALYVALLAGFWGGHKFLLGARREGWLYLAFAWSGITLLASLLDFVDLMRQPAIGQGFLRRRLPARHRAEGDRIDPATWRRLGRVTLAFIVAVTVVSFCLPGG